MECNLINDIVYLLNYNCMMFLCFFLIKYLVWIFYNWSDAIKNKYICDFKITIPDDYNYSNKINEVLDIMKTNNKKLISKAYFLLKSIMY